MATPRNRCITVDPGGRIDHRRDSIEEAATMTVATLLRTKADEVRTVRPWASVAEAVRLLGVRPRVGALVVTGEGERVLGIVGEREIVRALGERGAALLDASVENVMSRQIPTCAPGDTLGSVMGTMTVSRFRHIPVLDGHRLVGLVSIGDVVHARLKDTELEAAVLRDMVISRRG
jgi:CBS domain-containing protein